MITRHEEQDLKEQAGYIKHRTFEPSGSRIVVYRAAEQGIDIEERYAVVCELHGIISGVSSKRQALADMRHPIDFCQECFEAVADQLVKEGLLEVATNEDEIARATAEGARVFRGPRYDGATIIEHDDHEQHCEVCGDPIETHKLTPENWAAAVAPHLSKNDMLTVATVAMQQTEKFGARVSALAPKRLTGPDLAALMLRVAKDINKESVPS